MILVVSNKPAASQSVHLACRLLISSLTCCLFESIIKKPPVRAAGTKVVSKWKGKKTVKINKCRPLRRYCKCNHMFLFLSGSRYYPEHLIHNLGNFVGKIYRKKTLKSTYKWWCRLHLHGPPFPPLKSPLQGYTELNRDRSPRSYFHLSLQNSASVLLAQLILTIKSASCS